MKRTTVGLNIQAMYGLDLERSESLGEELARAWDEGWRACEAANCDNCYSCGFVRLGAESNPYRGGGE